VLPQRHQRQVLGVGDAQLTQQWTVGAGYGVGGSIERKAELIVEPQT